MRFPCLLLLLYMCYRPYTLMAQHSDGPVIQITPTFGNKPLVLDSVSYVTMQGDTISISRLRFYLSSFVLTLENGTEYKEPHSYHLIDAEEPSSYKIILKGVPGGKLKAIDFNIGVDSAMSVSGAMGGDLDPVKGMYWAWNSGYINAKLEGMLRSMNRKKKQPFEFHIGGYTQPDYVLRSVHVNCAEQKGSTIDLSADIAAWFNGWDKNKERSVMIPGPAATVIANRYSKMFNKPE